LLLPIHQELFPQINGPVILHVCGKTLDRMAMFAQSGVDVYHFESANDVNQAMEKVGDVITLAGNINNPEVLLNGTPETVYNETRKVIQAGLNLIAPECAVPLTTPTDNLKAIAQAVKEGY
jgi:[methyl-Co(III) methanol-specific corrinoid protein]:coenzyme M methyltransferase